MSCFNTHNTKQWMVGLLAIATFIGNAKLMNNTPECIENESDIEVVLVPTNVAGFVRNHQRLSNAIFPPAKMASFYIKIFIQFINISSNGSIISVGEPKKYTWSKSCLFVAVKYNSLYAMNVYSLGAISPNRRESELELTLPFVCPDVERNDQILNCLAKLEDLAIIPGNKDPRVNSVECVLEGHDDFHGATLGYQPVLDHVCWIIFAISFVLGLVTFWTTGSWLVDGHDSVVRVRESVNDSGRNDPGYKDRLRAYSLTITFLYFVVLELLLAVIALLIALFFHRGRYSFIYPSSYFTVSFAFPTFCCVMLCKRKFKNQSLGCTSMIYDREKLGKMKVLEGFLLLSYFMTIHHLIWVLIGVVTDPTWGLPVLVVVSSIYYCVYICVYYNMRDLPQYLDKRIPIWRFFISIIFVLALACLFVVLGIVGQIFLNRDPSTSIIGGTLVLTFSIWFNHFKKRKQESEKDEGSKNPLI